MKRVALFSDGWKRLITYAWVDGMMRYMSKSEEDICLYPELFMINHSIVAKTA